MTKGIIGKKIGMTQVIDNDGRAIPVTVIQAGPCWITQVKNGAKEGYSAVQLGFEQIAAEVTDEKARLNKVERRLHKPQRGHLGLLEADEKHPVRKTFETPVPAVRYLREFRVAEVDSYEEGQMVTVEIFKPGDHVDVIGTSKGKGFAGTIKRHNFHRGPKTHGQSDRERAPGSIGSTSTPGWVKKGMRMSGRMGNDRVTQLNLEVVVVDPERNLLAVRGSIPGAKGGLVTIRQTVKKL